MTGAQCELPLIGGFCCGPLFAPVVKCRPPVRTPGKEGVIHRAQTRRRTPKWLTADDWSAIRAMYREAARLTRETGELHVVDHIVPKIGGTVTGLHVPWNLQVLHWRENLRKGSTWWPDMPEVQLTFLDNT